MDENEKKRIQDIISGMQCDKNFKCLNSGIDKMCKLKKIGDLDYFECVEEKLFECGYALSFGGRYLCQCPLRLYMAKKVQQQKD